MSPWSRMLCAALLCGAAALNTLAQSLPPAVEQALQRAGVPREALSVVVQPVDGGAPRLSHLAAQPRNPASLMKLVTTQAGLELLGPGWTWRTPVWVRGRLRDGVLEGDITIQGRGDPKLTLERLWLLMRRLRAFGIDELRGDFVLDRSAFAPEAAAPGDFDGEVLRPYNVQPDALLLAFKALQLSFTPDPARGVARIGIEPPLAGLRADVQVPLADGPCNDWRSGLKATLSDPQQLRFAGRYPASCGERQWPVAYADPAGFNARLVIALWKDAGGRLEGGVREGTAPEGEPSFELQSPPLAEVVRDINKYSSNVMAQQLFLTLGLAAQGSGSPAAARATLAEWLTQRLQAEPGSFVIDNGSGLSREGRVSAQLLATLLQQAWASPLMPELLASLPLNGVDGTLKRSQAEPGRAHLKTGSLRDVVGIAGIVDGRSGRRHVLVALINHPQAQAARPALDALLQWSLEDQR